MRITVFGASGRTGRSLVQQAIENGHEVVAFVRGASAFGEPGDKLDVDEGDARDPEAVAEAIRGSDAVISVLSLGRAEDEPQHSDATRTVVAAAGDEGVRRIVVVANKDVFGDDEVTDEFAAHASRRRCFGAIKAPRPSKRIPAVIRTRFSTLPSAGGSELGSPSPLRPPFPVSLRRTLLGSPLLFSFRKGDRHVGKKWNQVGFGVARARLALGFLAFALGVAGSADAQDAARGRIAGKVVASTTREPLAFANISLFRAGGSRDSLGSPLGGIIDPSDDTLLLSALPA